MKVLFDFDAFNGFVGGVSRCMVNLIENLPEEVEPEIAIKVCDNVHFLSSSLKGNVTPCKVNPKDFITKKNFIGKHILYRAIQKYIPFFPTYRNVNKPLSIEALQKQDFDLFHCPSTVPDMYFLNYLQKKPFVLTVHDMISELYGTPGNVQAAKKALLVPRSSHIVTISQRSKEDLINILNVPEEKISVIYHGAPTVVLPVGKRIIEDPYFLFVGRRRGYKNFDQTLKDFAVFHSQYKEVKLVTTGETFNKEELIMIRKLGLQEEVYNIFATEMELANLYKYAIGFIYPSLYEGFGLPILEAFTYDCPTLLNDTSCFPEIGGNAAIYFHSRPDENSSDLPEKMALIYTMSAAERETLIEKGRIRCNFFSWKESSRQMADVYKVVIS